MEYILVKVSGPFSYSHVQLQSIPTRTYETSTVWVLLNYFLDINVDNARLDWPLPQRAKLVHLVVGESTAILHGGRKDESCGKALKNKDQECDYTVNLGNPVCPSKLCE